MARIVFFFGAHIHQQHMRVAGKHLLHFGGIEFHRDVLSSRYRIPAFMRSQMRQLVYKAYVLRKTPQGSGADANSAAH